MTHRRRQARIRQEMMQPKYELTNFVELGVVLIQHGENPFARLLKKRDTTVMTATVRMPCLR